MSELTAPEKLSREESPVQDYDRHERDQDEVGERRGFGRRPPAPRQEQWEADLDRPDHDRDEATLGARPAAWQRDLDLLSHWGSERDSDCDRDRGRDGAILGVRPAASLRDPDSPSRWDSERGSGCGHDRGRPDHDLGWGGHPDLADWPLAREVRGWP